MSLTCADWAEITKNRVLDDVTGDKYKQQDFFDGFTLRETGGSELLPMLISPRSSRPAVYSRTERWHAILRYKLKKSRRKNAPFVYMSRRRYAQSRPRHKGRFCAKQENV
jgi:hypothetical protein